MLLLALVAPSFAATLDVPGTYPSIAAAITAASPGDTIAVAAGTYTGPFVVRKDLTLSGDGGVTLTGAGPILDVRTASATIHGVALAPTSGGGLYTDTATVTLDHVSITGGSGGNGNAVHANAATLVLTDVTLTGNGFASAQGGQIYATDTALTVTGGSFAGGFGEKGGAIWMLRGSLTATGASFTGNTVTTATETGRGGAIRSQDSAVVLTDCTFDGNTAPDGYGGHLAVSGGSLTVTGGRFANGLAGGKYGGAIAAYQTSATITGTAFETNRATAATDGTGGHGGAILSYGTVPGSLVITSATFQGNSADGYGGAIRDESGPFTVTDSDFIGNSAAYGGALHLMQGADVAIDASRFSGNTATTGGGAVRWHPADPAEALTITASSFADNTTDGPGGALYASDSGAVSILDSSFSKNHGHPGGAVSLNTVSDTVVLRSTFCGNVSDATSGAYGGGLYVWNSGPSRVANSVFVDNTAAAWGGAVHHQSSTAPVLENDAFLSNSAAAGGAVGWAAVTGTFRNNIVGANTQDGLTGDATTVAPIVYNDFLGNIDAPVGGVFVPSALSTNNLTDDPQFAAWTDDGDCTNDVWTLLPASPLIDKGDPSLHDVDGSRSDIGPYGGPDADPDAWIDTDGDGEPDLFDCGPNDPTIHAGAAEVAYDGIDQDCDGHDLTDVDGDGADATAVGGRDCDDSDPEIGPQATDIPYDGIDQNCDGYDLTDADGDGYDGGPTGDDCDDDDARIHPGATEIAGDYVDQDCDGVDLPGPADTGDTDTNPPCCKPTAGCNCDSGVSDARWAFLLAIGAVIAGRSRRR